MPLSRAIAATALALAVVLAPGVPAGSASPRVAPSSTPGPSTTAASADPRPNSLPGPNSGAKPTQPGDRGGSLQFATFGLMCAGLAFIGWRIVATGRRARRRGSAHTGSAP